jgi:hypothetical protein
MPGSSRRDNDPDGIRFRIVTLPEASPGGKRAKNQPGIPVLERDEVSLD